METSDARVRELHRQRTGQDGRLFRAPGRVNLVGEHTDYAGGFCMPAALQFGTAAAISARADGLVRVYSADLEEESSCRVEDFPTLERTGGWTDYVFGVVQALGGRGLRLRGFDLTLAGDVPRNAGLSSSASLEVVVAFAVAQLAGMEISGRELALLCQAAENGFVGAPCGIMDQFISVHGRAGHALQLDCRDLSYGYVPLPDSTRLVITNSMVKHSVAGAEYAERRGQVEEGTRILQREFPDSGVKLLRDVSLQQLERARGAMPDVVYRRCRHVISDSQRVLDGGEMLRRGEVRAFGRLLDEAHASYRDDFGASCEECDVLVAIAKEQPGCLGARLTGGGFGGCVVSLVEAAEAETFRQAVLTRYRERTGITADGWVGQPSDGVHAATE